MQTDEFRNLLVRAQSVSDVGEIACREALKRLQVAAVTFVPFDRPVVDPGQVICVSDSIPPREINEMGLASLPIAARDLDTASALRHRSGTTFDNDRAYPNIARTELYNEFWVPNRVERQLVHVLGTPNLPVAWMAALRSARKPRFTDTELEQLQDIGEAATRAMIGLAQVGCRSPHDAAALFALQSAIPWPCFVFGEGGDLLWVNDDGVVRLSVDSFDLVGTRYLGGWSALLEALATYVRGIARRPSDVVRRAPVFLARYLAPGEQVAARWHAGPSGSTPTIVVTLTGPASPPRVSARPPTPDHRLTPRESEVASLVAQGYSLENVAHILEMRWSTVRVHLRNVYAKLGVVNRAQLTLAMLERAPRSTSRRPRQ